MRGNEAIRVALVDATGRVVNVIRATEDLTLEGYTLIPDNGEAYINSFWDGERFIKQEEVLALPLFNQTDLQALVLAQAEMIALLFEQLQGGSA